MDSTELSQFLFVCAIAFAALVAAPVVVFFGEAAERSRDRHGARGRGQRKLSTQHPVMQY